MRFGRLVAVVLCLGSGPVCAKPWAQMTNEEANKARAFLATYVVATVDCIAGAIPGNPKALALAQKRQWLAATALTGKACDSSFFQMKSAFDALIEPGAGQVYASNQFQKELPANLAKRVRIAQAAPPQTAPVPRSSAAATAETPSADVEAARRKLLDAALDKQWQCIRRGAADLVPYSNESAETLATVIVDKCAASQSEQVDVVVAAYGLSRQKAETLAAELAGKARRKVVSEIVTLRAEAAKAARNAPSEGFREQAPGTRDASSRSY